MRVSLLLAVAQTLSTNCCAQLQEQEASAAPPAEKLDSQGNTRRQAVSSSLPVQPPVRDESESAMGLHVLENIVKDQKAIWTSPSRLHLADADWLLPLGLATGGLVATDKEYTKHLPNSPSRLKRSSDLSNYGVASFVGIGGGLYFWGQYAHDDHKSETGFLAGEAAVDSLGVTSAFKYAFGRERPLQDGYRGKFWRGGDSFPSVHAAAAWSIASVIAHEYPGPLTTFLAYGLASAVSASRVTAKQHFPSDVLIGSAIGWYIGQHVYRAHHDPELGGGDWETYAEARDEPDLGTKSVGSPYVELDSWIYPALERLAALHYVRTEFLGMRPWTRLECARLVEEAGDQIRAEQKDPPDVNQLYDALAEEFSSDLDATARETERSARVESVYTRAMGIAGPPLNDSYHFGQTIINNYGRPYQQGFNSEDGVSAYATEGRFTLYLRAEYQHAPSAPAYSDAVRHAIATADTNPVQPPAPVAAVDQFRLLDTYVAATVANWNLAFGKQSLWWGPDYGGELIFSDNAEPIYMFRASRTMPVTLPWIFHWLGPLKVDAFYGKLSGNEFPPRPLIHGEKISFKPTPNLEFGFSRLAEMGGVGRALTFKAIFNSYTSARESAYFASNANPGKRTAGFDFSYRLPYLRDWLTIYTDSLSPDDVSPISAPRRAAVNPGIYLSRFPKLPKLDLRIEGVNTNTLSSSGGGHFVYIDNFYHDLSTNKGNIIGSWIGREATGVQAWTNYWFTPRTSLQLGYRHARVPADFIPGGGTYNDGSVRLNCWLRDVNLSTLVQYERWKYPLLASGAQTNVTTSLQLTYWPRWLKK